MRMNEEIDPILIYGLYFLSCIKLYVLRWYCSMVVCQGDEVCLNVLNCQRLPRKRYSVWRRSNNSSIFVWVIWCLVLIHREIIQFVLLNCACIHNIHQKTGR